MKVILLGLPKCGTVSFAESLNNVGIRACHYYDSNGDVAAHSVLRAIREGKKLFHYLEEQGFKAITQADCLNPPDWFFFPQRTFLLNIIYQYPEAKFILNYRNTLDHVASIEAWGDMSDRFKAAGVEYLFDFIVQHNSRVINYSRDMENFLKFKIGTDSNDLLRKFIHPDFNLLHLNKRP